MTRFNFGLFVTPDGERFKISLRKPDRHYIRTTGLGAAVTAIARGSPKPWSILIHQL